ncbi:MAG: ATP synthase F1 subunit delta [Candidatus Kapabacteria bacterium]|nr:ATP synthase F1 subunit delta [Candidatus Kapabacteria bacterium]
MSSFKIARRYAKSLIASAVADGSVDAVSADMAMVRSTIDSSKELQAMMRSPVITHSLKKSVIDELLSSKISPLTLSFLHLVIEKGRGGIWRDVADEVDAQIDTIRNVQRVDVTSAADLSAEERSRIEGSLSKSLGRSIIASYSVDASIIGGAVIRIGDQVHDGSLRHQLAVLGKQLAQA